MNGASWGHSSVPGRNATRTSQTWIPCLIIQFPDSGSCGVHSHHKGSSTSETTFVACCRSPTRDRICLFVAFFFCSHLTISLHILTSFSSGSRISILCMSNVIPRNVRQVVGPSTFSKARGTPNSLHTLVNSFKLSWQVDDPGGLWSKVIQALDWERNSHRFDNPR